MKYKVGSVGKVIVAALETGDPVYASIEKIAKDENIENGIVWIIGGVQNGGVVVGPGPLFPQDVLREKFSDPREIIGIGMLFKKESGEIKLHMHAGIGKGEEVIVGCPRESLESWLINEIVILELTGTHLKREKDSTTGFELLKI